MKLKSEHEWKLMKDELPKEGKVYDILFNDPNSEEIKDMRTWICYSVDKGKNVVYFRHHIDPQCIVCLDIAKDNFWFREHMK